MATITLTCGECGNSFDKERKEYNRRIRNNGPEAKFYCGSICEGKRKYTKPVDKTCPCGKVYSTTTGSNHCSRVCASLYSMTPERLAAMNAGSANTRFQSKQVTGLVAQALAVREADKYESVDSFLLCHDETYQFEFHLPGTNYIFDLVLPKRRLFIEFDERYHKHNVLEDEAKTKAAEQQGWKVHRIDVDGFAKPYPYELIYPALYGH